MMEDTILQVIRRDERFELLAEMLKGAGVSDAFTSRREVFTFFAPTDAAFTRFSRPVVRLMKCEEGKDLVLPLIARHLVTGSYLSSDDLQKLEQVKPLWGPEVPISVEKDELKYGPLPVVTPGIAARNGMVFPVNGLLPVRRRKIPPV